MTKRLGSQHTLDILMGVDGGWFNPMHYTLEADENGHIVRKRRVDVPEPEESLAIKRDWVAYLRRTATTHLGSGEGGAPVARVSVPASGSADRDSGLLVRAADLAGRRLATAPPLPSKDLGCTPAARVSVSANGSTARDSRRRVRDAELTGVRLATAPPLSSKGMGCTPAACDSWRRGRDADPARRCPMDAPSPLSGCHLATGIGRRSCRGGYPDRRRQSLIHI